MQKEIFTSIGLMTGTSMDGIDGVVIRTDGQQYIEYIAGDYLPFSKEIILELREAEFAVNKVYGDLNQIRDFDLSEIVRHFTILHAEFIKNLLKKSNLLYQDIDVIGFHGQTLYHNPSLSISIQIGDGKLLSNKTGIKVVNNFRENDIKNGGQGAPLAPLYHQALAAQSDVIPIGIINCGGISNITIINGKTLEEIVGFDTGPGNILLDKYIRIKTKNKEFMDENGKYGLSGEINYDILELLKKKSIHYNGHDFFSHLPPKSLDSSNFNLIDEIYNIKIEDACMTLAAFTAYSIVHSIDLLDCNIPRKWVLSGGGWKNPLIDRFLRKFFTEKIKNISILNASELQWRTQYMEAEIFAYLAVRTIQGLVITIPNTTGVLYPMPGGVLNNPD